MQKKLGTAYVLVAGTLWGSMGVFVRHFNASGLGTMENSRASILASVEPVVAALFSLFLFHEPMSVSGAVGMLLVLGAVLLLSVPKKATT